MRLKDPMSCNDVSMPLDGLIMQSFCIVKLTEIFLNVVALLSYGERTFARENFFLFRKGKDKALQAWRERMRNNQSAQFKRVAKTSSPMTMNLFHSDQPDSVTTNVTQAFQMLKSFWVDVWKGHDLDEQTN